MFTTHSYVCNRKRSYNFTQTETVQGTMATHPPTSSMVIGALQSLESVNRRGSSLQAVKKFIFSTYQVDENRIVPFIKRYLVSAIEKGIIIRTKGVGLAGAFKLAPFKPQSKKKVSKEKASANEPKKASSVKQLTKDSKANSVKSKKNGDDVMPASAVTVKKMKEKRISFIATKVKKVDRKPKQ